MTELLEHCARLHILVTSREVLRVSGEHQFEVPPLPVPERSQEPAAMVGQSEAVRLFVDRARAVREDFELDDTTAPVVAEIVRRLEGLPLAIELAAARIRLLPPAALLQRLTNRLQLLTRGPRDLPERQQTLRNTIDWSYGLLEEGEKALLARLGVFIGGWTLDAVEVVCAEHEEMDSEEALSSLIDKSLARPDGFAGDEPRFRMLEFVREYALERLGDRGEIDRRRDLHAEYFFALAKKAAPETATAAQDQWLERLAAESGNFRAAMRWLLDRGAPGRAAQMGSALWNCWWLPCGDLQMHTLWSDGAGSPAEMAEAGSRLGYEFIAITDHTAGLRIARGMSPERIRLQREEIARLPSPPLRIFAGVEANVALSGELDVTAQDLAGTEIVLAGCHAALRRVEDQTPRLVAAVSHPMVHCLAHPRGRVFNLPRGIRARWDEVFEAAAAHGTAVEVNAFPDRQDLDASLLPAAARAECLISLGTDSHSPRQLPWIDIAVAQLVRSGVQRDQVLNYWSADTLAAWLRRKP